MVEPNKIDESQRLDRLDWQGNWSYPSAASTGHVEIELPTLPGSPNAVERLHARDFGQHVISRIESSMKQNPYLKSGPQQNPAEVFRHYAAVAKGAQLMDEGALRRKEQIAAEFTKEPEQAQYYETVVKPYLGTLTPRRRR